MTTPLAIRIATNSAPLQTLDAILAAHGLPRQGDKVAAAALVADLIAAGKVDIAALRGTATHGTATQAAPKANPKAAPKAAPQPVPQPAPQGAEIEQLRALVQTAHSRLDAIQPELSALAQGVRTDGDSVRSMLTALGANGAAASKAAAAANAAANAASAKIDALSAEIGKHNPAAAAASAVRSLASEQVMAAVREAFAPFKAIVESQGQQAAVATLAIEPEQRELWPGYVGAHWGHPQAPAIDAGYVWPDALIRSLMSAQKRSRNVWLAGPKGSGKSTAAEQFAARSGRVFYRIQFNRYSTAEDFIGGMGLVEGRTEFVPGTMLVGLTTPGAVVLLDEVSTADPGVLAILHGLLEPCSTIHIGGRPWTRAPGTMILAADNTAGSGDSTGRYAGTREQNSALLDRFGTMILIDAMSVDQMTTVLSGRTGCTERLARHIAQAFAACAVEVTRGNVIDAPSLRRAVALIECLQDGIPPTEAWQQAVQLHQPAEGAAGLYSVFCTHVDSSLIAEEI